MLRIICIVGIVALVLDFGLDLGVDMGVIISSKSNQYLTVMGE
mgnify:CR=1 FL=1